MKKYLNKLEAKEVPLKIRDKKLWIQNRRSFVKNSVLLGTFSSSLFWQSCAGENFDHSPLSKKQFLLINAVQSILFPSDGNGPGAIDVHADRYIIWMLNDKRMDAEEMEFLINGMDWLDEESQKQFKQGFVNLKLEEKEQVVLTVAQESWGESWLSVNLTYIFEALLSDPIYGFNTEEQGWRWLEHIPGEPRPNEQIKYDQIFKVLNF